MGRRRSHNEDRFLLLPEFNVFVVADGMGGHKAGEVASRMAVTAVASYFRARTGEEGGAAAGDRLCEAIRRANGKIFERADDSPAHRGMGTTLVAAFYSPADAKLYVGHAGDSRCYRIRGGEMRQITRDHSLLAEALLERPELSEIELSYLPKNVLTRALGIHPNVEIDLETSAAELGDVFLLCSDGLHGLVSDAEIAAIVQQNEALPDACARLVEAANENGGRDNITAVLVRIEDGEAPWVATLLAEDADGDTEDA